MSQNSPQDAIANDEVTVVFASDARGILPLSVAAWSVAENAAQDTTCHICILSDGIEQQAQENLKQLIAKAGVRHRLSFIDISGIVPADLNVTACWPRAAWGRIFLPNLLPNTARVIYLDIDTLTCTDLKELLNLPMGDAALGVVLEHESHEGSHFNERLHIPQNCLGYFNSGVLLMNLEVFRRDNLVDKVVQFAQKNSAVLTCPDQDALNGALCDRLIQIHPRWNWHDGLTRLILKRDISAPLWRGNPPKQSLEAALYPGILHYQGQNKPWLYNYRIEGQRYADSMLRAGLVDKLPLPGCSFSKWLKNKSYKVIYALTWAKIRRLAHKLGVKPI